MSDPSGGDPDSYAYGGDGWHAGPGANFRARSSRKHPPVRCGRAPPCADAARAPFRRDPQMETTEPARARSSRSTSGSRESVATVSVFTAPTADMMSAAQSEDALTLPPYATLCRSPIQPVDFRLHHSNLSATRRRSSRPSRESVFPHVVAVSHATVAVAQAGGRDASIASGGARFGGKIRTTRMAIQALDMARGAQKAGRGRGGVAGFGRGHKCVIFEIEGAGLRREGGSLSTPYQVE